MLTAAATSFSFGLDEKSDPANERHLLHKFVAYLKLALDEETYNKYIPPDVSEESKHSDGLGPYPPSKSASPPSSLLVQVAILGGNTPNAAGPFWETVSSALEMQRIHTLEAWANWNTRRRLGWK